MPDANSQAGACYTGRMRAAAIIVLLATACGDEWDPIPAPSNTPDTPAQPTAASLRAQLAAFFPLDHAGEGPRLDRVRGLELTPWQRTGWGQYEVDASGTLAVPGRVGAGQLVAGSEGFHFATWSAPALDHAGGSFTWAGWLALDAAVSDGQHRPNQTWLAKWNGIAASHASARSRARALVLLASVP